MKRKNEMSLLVVCTLDELATSVPQPPAPIRDGLESAEHKGQARKLPDAKRIATTIPLQFMHAHAEQSAKACMLNNTFLGYIRIGFSKPGTSGVSGRRESEEIDGINR